MADPEVGAKKKNNVWYIPRNVGIFEDRIRRKATGSKISRQNDVTSQDDVERARKEGGELLAKIERDTASSFLQRAGNMQKVAPAPAPLADHETATPAELATRDWFGGEVASNLKRKERDMAETADAMLQAVMLKQEGAVQKKAKVELTGEALKLDFQNWRAAQQVNHSQTVQRLAFTIDGCITELKETITENLKGTEDVHSRDTAVKSLEETKAKLLADAAKFEEKWYVERTDFADEAALNAIKEDVKAARTVEKSGSFNDVNVIVKAANVSIRSYLKRVGADKSKSNVNAATDAANPGHVTCPVVNLVLNSYKALDKKWDAVQTGVSKRTDLVELVEDSLLRDNAHCEPNFAAKPCRIISQIPQNLCDFQTKQLRCFAPINFA